MQEIAAAIQEGAQAYLKRQYTDDAMSAWCRSDRALLLGPDQRGGFVLGSILSGAAGSSAMNISGALETCALPPAAQKACRRGDPRVRAGASRPAGGGPRASRDLGVLLVPDGPAG
jgi:K(+)-stimulated pyrophosphate-energized sodium pump